MYCGYYITVNAMSQKLDNLVIIDDINRENNRRGYKLLWYTGKKQHQENFIGPIDR